MARGFFPGSELGWANWKPEGFHPAEEFFRYALLMPSPGPTWKATDFDFDHDYKRLGLGALYSDSNPDLRNDFSRGEIAIETLFSGGTKITVKRAAYLR